jgi:hypothetical protein
VAWHEIVTHRKPVIQGVRNVIGGNSYRAARPPGGGLCVSQSLHRIIRSVELCMKTQCPNCGQFKLQSKRMRMLYFGAGFLVLSALIIPAVVCLPAAIVCFIVAPFRSGQFCTNCRWTTGQPIRKPTDIPQEVSSAKS